MPLTVTVARLTTHHCFRRVTMSDPRFARLKTDPRFRRIKKKEAKVVVDARFKSIFDQSTSKKKDKKGKG